MDPPTTDFSKYSFFPIHHENLLKFYRRQVDMLWTPQEIDMSQDRTEWKTMDEPTRNMVKYVLCFFAQADGLVIENIAKRFQEESSELLKEAGHFYAAQNLIETVHNEMYSIMIDVFITEPVERAKALNAIQHYPSIRQLGEWMQKWMTTDRSLGERIVAFACVEGIIFVAFFVEIWFVKRLNKLPGLCKANEFIARDEALHTLFAVELYKTLRATATSWPPLEEEVETVTLIVQDAVEIAERLAADSLPCDLTGLRSADLVQYIRLAADNLLIQLGLNPCYAAVNPFPWMIQIGMANKTNFFEQRVSEYSKLDSSSNLTFDVQAEF